MDSLSGYVAGASTGGAAGELIVREGLTRSLEELGFKIDIADSDASMEAMTGGGKADAYDLFFFDPWTIVDPDNRVRSYLRGRERDTFVLAFFGWTPDVAGFAMEPSHVLTAYPLDAQNTFLGFVIEPNAQAVQDRASSVTKGTEGVVWGKKADYFKDREGMLKEVAAKAKLHIVSKDAPLGEGAANVVYHGSLNRDGWRSLLAKSRFLIGLGNPLLGPSALDAVAAGCVYIDPVYDGVHVKPLHDSMRHMKSQHPYMRDQVGPPYVCAADLTDSSSVQKCIDHALEADLPPYVPVDFTAPALLERVRGFVVRWRETKGM
jgi:hypothetical protein